MMKESYCMNGVETEYVKILKDAMNDAFVVLQDAKAEQEALSKETGKAQAEAQASGIAEGTPAVVQAQAEVNSKVVQEAEKVIPQMRTSGQEIIAEIGNGAKAEEPSVSDKIRGIINNIKGLFTGKQGFEQNSPSKWAYRVGSYLIQGLTNGVEQNRKQATNATNSMVKDIKSTVEGKKGFDVHSPSKYFYEIGSYLMQGIANGVSDNKQKVLQAMEELSFNALQKAKAKPNQAIVIENAPLGVEAGVAAGIFTIGVNTGPLDDEVLLSAGANMLVSDMQTLADRFEEIYTALKQ